MYPRGDNPWASESPPSESAFDATFPSIEANTLTSRASLSSSRSLSKTPSSAVLPVKKIFLPSEARTVTPGQAFSPVMFSAKTSRPFLDALTITSRSLRKTNVVAKRSPAVTRTAYAPGLSASNGISMVCSIGLYLAKSLTSTSHALSASMRSVSSSSTLRMPKVLRK